MISTIFYSLLPLMALNDVYYVFNWRRMDGNFKRKDMLSVTRLDALHYLLKLVSFVWPLFGVFGSFWPLFLALLLLWVMKFVVYHVYEPVYPAFSRIALWVGFVLKSLIFYLWVTR